MLTSFMNSKKQTYSLYILSAVLIFLYNFLIAKSTNGMIYAVLMPLFLFIMPIVYKIFRLQPVQRLTSDILLFCFFAFGIGVALGKFQQWNPFYDKAVHTWSGYLFGMIGFCAYYYLKKDKKIEHDKDAVLATVFSVVFGMAIGVVWEFMEFTMDTFTGSDTQQVAYSGVSDTMLDLIADTLGALIAAVFIYRYLKYRKENGFMIKTFEDFAEKNILN